MSVTDVTSRIGQIQSQLALLAPRATANTSSAFALSLRTAATPSVPGLPGAAGTSTSGEAVVAAAKKYLGVPYVWGGTDPAKGLGCSGLVQQVYEDLGYDLPRVSYQQAEAGRPVTGGLANAQPGDILAFGSPVHHVGIYIGDNQMIEAPRPGLDVRIGPVYETPSAIRRVVPDGGVERAAEVLRLRPELAEPVRRDAAEAVVPRDVERLPLAARATAGDPGRSAHQGG